MSKVVLNSRIKKMECGGKSIPQEYIVCFNDYIKNVINTRVDQEIAELNKIIAKKFELGKFKSVNELIYAYKSLEKEYTKSRQRISELEEQLKNAIVLEPDYYVIITNGWKNKKYGVALSQQRVQWNYIQETDGNMGCYVPCVEFGKFATLEEAEAKLRELQGEKK